MSASGRSLPVVTKAQAAQFECNWVVKSVQISQRVLTRSENAQNALQRGSIWLVPRDGCGMRFHTDPK